jgi:predicted secreted hydrolase
VRRRTWLTLLATAPLAAGADAAPPAIETSAETSGETSAVQRGRVLAFPRDHGAHLAARTEWWYLTGWLGTIAQPRAGFQVTFFRSRTGLAEDLPGRFAPRQLLFAHAALTDLARGRHHHADRIARWSGEPDAPLARASVQDTDVHIGRWSIVRDGAGVYRARVDDEALTLDLAARPTQPLLLQGDAGFSRKGPAERQASHYVTEPQLAVTGRVGGQGGQDATGGPGRAEAGADGRGWLDHEWSDEILHPDALGWDWIGMNLADGGALTAFQLRRADGSALWAGGSWRPAGGQARAFAPADLRFEPLRHWASPATGARYPVQWRVQTPAGRFEVISLLDAQELDGRRSTGSVYWEGLSALHDDAGRRVGLGYLEMTGYAGRLQL